MKNIIFLLVAIALMVPGQTHEMKVIIKPKVEIKKIVELLPQLKPICACESAGQKNAKPTHYDKNGNVLRGIQNPHDIGECQINLDAHQKEAKKMGLDLFNEQDNIIFANMLYQREGSIPWNWSKACWE